jgi:glycosyltransferase involved in cell wall biosynthesis
MGASEVSRQVLGHVLMQIALAECCALIVPSRGFLQCVKWRGTYAMLSACVFEGNRNQDLGAQRRYINVVLGGLINDENGLAIFRDSVEQIRTSSRANDYVFTVCGYGAGIQELRERWKEELGPNLNVCGYLSRVEYGQILSKAHICLALQNHTGLHSARKLPSKVFEAMSVGKLVIASPFVEFLELPSDSIVLLTEHSAKALTAAILSVNYDMIVAVGNRAAEVAADRWSSVNASKTIEKLVLERNDMHVGCVV